MMAHVVRSSSRQLFTFAKRILVSQQESIILTRAHSYTVSDAFIYFFGFQHGSGLADCFVLS